MNNKDYHQTDEYVDLSVFREFREDRGGEVGDTKLHPDHPPQKKWYPFGEVRVPHQNPPPAFTNR
ncbi:MAG: hypothetical protein AB7T38_11620 [Nitrospirales bacterium]